MELLPLGTVVKRRAAAVPIMIIGYFPYDAEENLWQYMGTNIFLGTGLNSDKLAFNEESIEEILFTGYSDAEGETYRKELAEAMELAPLGRRKKEDRKQEAGDK